MTDPMVEEQRISEIRQRSDRATCGPWEFRVVTKRMLRDPSDHSVMIGAVAPGHQIRATPSGGTFPSNDGEFIAHAREDVPFLLKEIAALEQRITTLEAENLEALKAEGQKDVWVDMLSDSFRGVVLAACEDDSWEGTVAEGLDLLQKKFTEVNSALEAAEARYAALQAERDQQGKTLEAIRFLAEQWNARKALLLKSLQEFDEPATAILPQCELAVIGTCAIELLALLEPPVQTGGTL